MKEFKKVEYGFYESSNEVMFLTELKNLKFQKNKNEIMVTLVDNDGFEILKGYGMSPTEAINDLHSNLL